MKRLVIDVDHHWMPDEHYRRPELYVRREREVAHEVKRKLLGENSRRLFR